MVSNELKKVTDEFIASKRRSETTRTEETYRRKLDIFLAFLNNKGLNDCVSHTKLLSEFGSDSFIESVKFYIEEYKIGFRSTTDNYKSVVTELFKYLKEVEGITNETFNDNSKNRTMDIEYEKLIKVKKLSDREKVEPMSYEDVKGLITICEDAIDKGENLPLSELIVKKGAFTNYMSAIICKLVAFLGLKNDVVLNLKMGEFDETTGKTTISGYRVALPKNLWMQMKKYIVVRKSLLPEWNSDSLIFATLSDARKLDNGTAFALLQKIIDSRGATALQKYAIIQHIKSGMPMYMIEDLTGCGDDIIRHCHEVLREEYNNTETINLNELVEKYTRGNEILFNL